MDYKQAVNIPACQANLFLLVTVNLCATSDSMPLMTHMHQYLLTLSISFGLDLHFDVS